MPLIAPHPESAAAWADLQAALAGLRGALDAVQADRSLAPEVEHSALRVSAAVARLRELAAEMPGFHDLPLLHEILVLGLQHLQGRGDYRRELEERLRPLASMGGVSETVGEAAGGIYLFLHVTRDPADLSQALTLLERSDVLVPVPSESEDPALDAGDARGFQALGVEFDALQADFEDLLAGRPALGPRFDSLVALMEGVWSGSLPDSHLEEALLEVVEAQEGFRRFLARRGAVEMLQALEAQGQALRWAFRYLETGEPDLLLQAYEDLLAPTLELAALEASESAPVACVFCGAANSPGSSRCGRCSKPLPAAMVTSAGVDDAPAASSENFQRLADLLDDAMAGAVTPGDAQDRLLPLWDAVLQVEARAADPVLAADRVRDPALGRRQEELQALVSGLRDVLAEIFEALDLGALDRLPALRSRALGLGEDLARFHVALSG